MSTDQGPKVLLIEDEEVVHKVVVPYLTKKGCAIVQSFDGSQGLEDFRRHRPDIVLLDLRLPGLDGLQVLDIITRESSETQVIIISGQGAIDDVITSLKLGAWDYLIKPFPSLDVLGHSVAKAFEKVKMTRENQRYRERLEEEVRKRTGELEERTRELEGALAGLEQERTGRTRAEKAVSRERAFLQTLIDGVIDPAMVVGLDYKIIMMNESARNRLPPELKNKDELFCFQIHSMTDTSCHDAGYPCPLEKILDNGKEVTVVHTCHVHEGGEEVFEIKASPLWNEDGSLRGFLEICRNMTAPENMEAKLRDHESRLYQLTHYDSLTGLPNRMLFQDRLQRMMLRAQRLEQNVAIMFLDLDRFKKINETLGHEIGDKLLFAIAERLQNCVRKSDTVARISGDEFAIILDDIKDPKFVTVVTRKIMQALARQVTIRDFELYLTTSIGISIYPADSTDVEGLMRCADTAVFRAKDSGRNNYQFYTSDMNVRAFEYLLMESGLRKAIEHDELVVYYQPQFHMKSHKLIGMEALLRWQHPERGMISPNDFIPLAEETGLIETIGEWVLRAACRQNKAWQDEGYPPVRLAVNLSARQFRQTDIVEIVADSLKETGLDPNYLELELTESIVMHDTETTISTLNRLSRMGVKLAIDDFGTGYSSLSYLKLFPLDNLKIDRSFVMNISTDINDAMIASSIIALAHSMKLKVIAEGVEDEKQLELLRKQGCDNVQGFLFGRPVPAAEFIRFFEISGAPDIKILSKS